ncbi:caspase, EACC1-associated type [Streptomyces sp. NPDC055210]
MGDLSASGTRVVLVGTGRHVPDSGLPDVPAAANTVRELARVLVERCGVHETQLRVLIDPDDPARIARVLTAAAEECDDTLLVHYVGHGLIGPDSGLYLATGATRDLFHGAAAYQALPFTVVQEILASSRARCTVAVLDCCFAGRAPGWSGKAGPGVFEVPGVQGGYLLASAARIEVALAPAGSRYSAFTGELLRLIEEGVPTGPPELTFDDVFRHLERVLPGRSIPVPHRWASGRAGELVLLQNPAYRPPEPEARQPAADTGPSPYPGLGSFSSADARWFHGRDRLIEELISCVGRRLEQRGPVVVVGASGAGKSSLLRAGLIPALSRSVLPGTGTWPVMLLDPGEHPLEALVGRLADAGGAASVAVRNALTADPSGIDTVIRAVLRQRGQAGDARLVVIVDQFEEVFTRCRREEERGRFVEMLCASSAALVILGLRADFYSPCTSYEGLVSALELGQLVVGPMRPEELRSAIVEPARAAGLALEKGLPELLLRDLGRGSTESAAAGRLPLLAHALLSTWQRREGHVLTLAGYEATGGIRDALARTAEGIYEALPPEGRDACRRLMLRLVVVGEGTEDTRRAARPGDLFGGRPEVGMGTREVVEALASARLLTSDERSIEITHEALLAHWPRLREWIDSDRAGIRLRQQLADAARQWESAQRDRSFLYSGSRLADAVEWAKDPRHSDELTVDQRTFLDSSQGHEQQRVRRTRRFIAVLMALVLAVTGAGLFAFVQSSELREQTRTAIALAVTDAARTRIESRPDQAALLAVEAMRAASAGAARGVAEDVLLRTERLRAMAHFGKAEPLDIVAVPHRGYMALAMQDRVLLWDHRRHRLKEERALPVNIGPVAQVVAAFGRRPRIVAAYGSKLQLLDLRNRRHSAFPVSAEGDKIFAVDAHPVNGLVAWGTFRGAVGIGDTDGGMRRRELLRAPGTSTGQSILRVKFSPDGRTVAAADSTGSVTVWDTDTKQVRTVLRPFEQGKGTVQEMAFRPGSPTTLAVLSRQGGTVEFWDTRTGASRGGLRGSEDSVTRGELLYGLAFSPDGDTLAVSTRDAVQLWQPDGQGWQMDDTLKYQGQNPRALGFTADGKALAVAGDAEMVLLWDMPPSPPASSLFSTHWLQTVVSADGRATVTYGRKGIYVWNLDGRTPTARRLRGPPDATAEIALSPDGRLLAVAVEDMSRTPLVEMWDVRRRKALGPPFEVTRRSAAVMDLAFDKDSRILVTAAGDRSIRFWAARARRPLSRDLPVRDAAQLDLLPDGVLRVGAEQFSLWVPDRQRRLASDPWEESAGDIVMDWKGRTAAVLRKDGSIEFWNVSWHRSLSRTSPPKETDAHFTAAAFTPDGRTLVAVAALGTLEASLRFYDVRSGNLTGSVSGNFGSADIAMAPSGAYLLVFGSRVDKVDRARWRTDPQNVSARLCAIAGRNLTPEEWGDLLPKSGERRATCPSYG